MFKLINIFGLGPGWGSSILPMSPQRSRAAMTCCSTAFWANVRHCTFYAAEDLPKKNGTATQPTLKAVTPRFWLPAVDSFFDDSKRTENGLGSDWQ